MSFNIRIPSVTATTMEGKLMQLHSFLYQTVEQLNWALNAIETGSGSGSAVVQKPNSSGDTDDAESSVSNFNEIKSLIIKSADIVNAYYEKISAKLSGEYVAQSVFGTFQQQTELQLKANSDSISQNYTNLQQIRSDVGAIEDALVDVNAHIKTGLLYYDENGVPIYGVEVGQKNAVDGVEVFNKYARFIAEKLSFYDSNGYEVAYISDKKLFITHIEVTKSFSQGGFVDLTQEDGSIVTRWIGGVN